MHFLIRLAQVHEAFRRAELEAVATIAEVDLEIVSYNAESPFCIVSLANPAVATSLISQAFLPRAIYELWGSGSDYDALHKNIKSQTSDQWILYRDSSFRFSIDAFQGKRSTSQQRDIINSFSYLGFTGQIDMINPQQEFTIFEEWKFFPSPKSKPKELLPKRLFFGRHIADSRRSLVDKYDLKKRPYISTTSMDAELAMVTANLCLASPGKLIYDPFVGTGSFAIASAASGAYVFGSDIDGRSFKGKNSHGIEAGIGKNLHHYGLRNQHLDCWTSDLTNSPVRRIERGFLDAIICDPPYGVREGLRVLGAREGRSSEEVLIDGIASYKLDGFIAPRKPYAFTALLYDILVHAADMLVVGGRLVFWMPTANEDEGQHFDIPTHPNLTLLSCCVQPFNKWSRRLLTYEKIAQSGVASNEFSRPEPNQTISGTRADDLNPFRHSYFRGSKSKKVQSRTKSEG
ncbi:MAG: hypothetical protein Q9160_000874 [Pyrenula sp. 1 TL-2023]